MNSKILSLLLCLGFFFLTACNQNAEEPATVQPTEQNQKPANKVDQNTPTLVKNDKNQNLKGTVNQAQANKGNVSWVTVNDLENKQKAEKRKVMVDLYTDWCGWCKRMDKATFQHANIADYLNDNFYAVKFNAEDKNTIKFKNKDHKFVAAGRRGYNELAHNFANGRMSYPTIAFLDEDLNRIDSYPGYKQPNQFDALLKFIDGNHYKTTSLQAFQSNFKSEIPASLGAPNAKRKIAAGKKGNKITIDPSKKNIKKATQKGG